MGDQKARDVTTVKELMENSEKEQGPAPTFACIFRFVDAGSLASHVLIRDDDMACFELQKLSPDDALDNGYSQNKVKAFKPYRYGEVLQKHVERFQSKETFKAVCLKVMEDPLYNLEGKAYAQPSEAD